MNPTLRRWAGRALGVCLVSLLLGYIPYVIYANSGLVQYVKLRDQAQSLRATNRQLYQTTEELKRSLDALSDSSLEEIDGAPKLSQAAVEQAARDELGLVHPGEMVFRVVRE